ncbi:hypothetical protein ACFFRR_008045 [Megaselia abdita]
MNYLIPTIFICLQIHNFGASEKLESPKSLLSRLQSLDNEKSSEEHQSPEDFEDNVAEIDVRNPLSTVKIDYDNNIITLESRGGWTRDEEKKRAMNQNFMRFGKRQNEYTTTNDVKQYEDREEQTRDDDFNRYSRPSSHFMRFGRGNEFMRFGKRANDFMRFGRANANNFMRFGRSPLTGAQVMRFGRSSEPFFSGKKVDNNFMRFGRPDSFMRFGRGGSDTESHTYAESKPEKPNES